jgi:glycosyltransferase involved in cell wall biosynthesis
MKIAIYWEQQDVGGVEVHLLTLLNNWPDKNDEFVLFSHENNPAFKRIAHKLEGLDYVENVSFSLVSFAGYLQKIKKVPFSILFKLFGYLCKPLFLLNSIYSCRKLFAKFGHFDAVLSDNGCYPGASGCLAAIIAAKKLNIKKRMLLIHHAAAKPEILWGTFEHFMDRLIYRSATDIVAVSQATRETIINFRWFDTTINPIRVIYNGVDVFFPSEKKQENDIRETYSLGDSILVGIVGRIERYKGHEDLILGISLLSKEHQEKIKLVFIGPGDDDEIERLKRIKNHCNLTNDLLFTGYIPGDPQEIIAQLDLLAVMTKDFEGFGLTLAEAMSVGVPILATNIGAIPEFVDKEVGTLIPPESPDMISERITDFIRSPSEYQLKAQKAKQHILKFSGQKMANRFHQLLVI